MNQGLHLVHLPHLPHRIRQFGASLHLVTRPSTNTPEVVSAHQIEVLPLASYRSQLATEALPFS